jgi:hypothetical protein
MWGSSAILARDEKRLFRSCRGASARLLIFALIMAAVGAGTTLILVIAAPHHRT